MSLSPGNPAPKYWFGTPLAATPISQSQDLGFFHGSSVSPAEKYIYRTTLMTSSATTFRFGYIMDYLMYYPLIDDGTTDPQIMDNTQTLPRYTDGKGVQMMAISVAGRTGGQSFYVTYTNQDGVTGRTSGTVVQNTSAALGAVVTSNTAGTGNTPLFIPLQEGDTGVRAVESVVMIGADVGLFSIVLVKPLVTVGVQEANVPQEESHVYEKTMLAEIKPDAFLGAVVFPSGSLSGVSFLFDIQTIWSN